MGDWDVSLPCLTRVNGVNGPTLTPVALSCCPVDQGYYQACGGGYWWGLLPYTDVIATATRYRRERRTITDCQGVVHTWDRVWNPATNIFEGEPPAGAFNCAAFGGGLAETPVITPTSKSYTYWCGGPAPNCSGGWAPGAQAIDQYELLNPYTYGDLIAEVTGLVNAVSFTPTPGVAELNNYEVTQFGGIKPANPAKHSTRPMLNCLRGVEAWTGCGASFGGGCLSALEPALTMCKFRYVTNALGARACIYRLSNVLYNPNDVPVSASWREVAGNFIVLPAPPIGAPPESNPGGSWSEREGLHRNRACDRLPCPGTNPLP